MSSSRVQYSQKAIGNVECIVASHDGEYHHGLPTIVLLHGYGADASDLAPLASAAESLTRKCQWVFPQAPKELQFGGFVQGRAWFDIDHAALEQAMAAGTYRDLTVSRPPDLDAAVDYLNGLIIALSSVQKEIHLGGFSQGAMMSTELTLQQKLKNQATLLILSGAYLDAENWQGLAKERSGFPFFQSHGTKDPLLDPAAAKALNEMLIKNGWVSNYFEFIGEHTIPPDIFDKALSFLNENMDSKK